MLNGIVLAPYYSKPGDPRETLNFELYFNKIWTQSRDPTQGTVKEYHPQWFGHYARLERYYGLSTTA